MIIDSGNFKVANSAVFGPAPPGGPETKATEKTTEKQFLLEGLRDMYTALPRESDRGLEDGPIYPTIGTKLYPALDAMETTMDQLGKHPTPEEVDRSNVRRLIRAFQPVAEAYSDSYKEKKFKKAMKTFQKVASRLGKYKDVSVIETQVRAISPKGIMPFEIEKKLKKESAKRAEKFQETFKDFRKEDMDKALKILSKPKGLRESDPAKIEELNKDKMSHSIEGHLDNLEKTGLVHDDPHEFHEGRKSLRKTLNSINAAEDLFPFDKKDVDTMTHLVSIYGEAQDKNIAYEWLSEHGFEKEAAIMSDLYRQDQEKALAEADKFMKSGTLERIRNQIQA